MATGRTHPRFVRFYADGYDLSGYSRMVGPLVHTFDEGNDDAFGTDVIGKFPGHSTIGIGSLNGLFDNTATSGLHIVMNGAGTDRDIMIPIGIRAAPVDFDPVFACQLEQLGYHGNQDSNPTAVNIPFGNTVHTADNLVYSRPWGNMMHAKAAETGSNTATGLDQDAQTTAGGWMMYQVFAGDGTAAIRTQDASTNTNPSFSDFLTTGFIDCSSPTSGVVASVKTATVERYVRWQISLGTASTVTFALSFHRNVN